MLSGRMPPTANTSASLGNTARQALSTAGDSSSAGNIFRPSAPASSAAKASVNVDTPGTQIKSEALRLANDRDVRVRHDDEPAAGLRYSRHVGHLDHGAGAGQTTFAEALGQQRDTRQRIAASSSELRECENRCRTSAAPIAGISSGVMPRSTAISGNGARYETQRRRVHACKSPACWAMRHKPRAAAAAGPSTPPIAAMLNAVW